MSVCIVVVDKVYKAFQTTNGSLCLSPGMGMGLTEPGRQCIPNTLVVTSPGRLIKSASQDSRPPTEQIVEPHYPSPIRQPSNHFV